MALKRRALEDLLDTLLPECALFPQQPVPCSEPRLDHRTNPSDLQLHPLAVVEVPRITTSPAPLTPRSGTVPMMLALLLAWTVAATDSLPAATRVLWTPQSYVAMRFLYERISLAEHGVEFAACLRATRRGDAWVVTEVSIPAQSGNSSEGIAEAGCPAEFPGVAHSHPLWRSGGELAPEGEHQRNCYPSPADFASFRASAQQFMVLWCDRDSFAYRTRDGGIGGKDIQANRAYARDLQSLFLARP